MKIIQISAGRERSIALMENGEARGWGAFKKIVLVPSDDFRGAVCSTDNTEIGHNRFAQPIAQTLNPNAPFTAVADGYIDTLAILRDGNVLTCRPVLALQMGLAHLPVPDMPSSTIQVAHSESGAFALHADGRVWSWGMNANGQLGRVTPLLQSGPGMIDGLPPITKLAAGNSHMLALDQHGRIWAWGSNSAGQLGNGTLKPSLQPIKIVIPVPIKHIASGDTHSLAVDVNGHLWSWGANNHGQAGNTAATYYTQPTRIKTEFLATQIDAGMFYTTALSAHGEVFAWGWNGLGQTGQASTNTPSKPQRIKQLANITSIAAGAGHVLATNGAAVFAWGDNRSAGCGVAASRSIQQQPIQVSLA